MQWIDMAGTKIMEVNSHITGDTLIEINPNADF